jgi:hypothetical protein
LIITTPTDLQVMLSQILIEVKSYFCLFFWIFGLLVSFLIDFSASKNNNDESAELQDDDVLGARLQRRQYILQHDDGRRQNNGHQEPDDESEIRCFKKIQK